MLASTLIIVFSLVLFVYWFRASCRLLLRNHQEQSSAPAFSEDVQFSFPKVQNVLKTGGELAPLFGQLNHDFQILTYLRQHAAALESGSFEDRLLILDYRIMAWYGRMMSKAAPAQTREALAEMASVIGVLAHKLGPQTVSEFES